MKRVRGKRYRMIECAGYCVTFRFATKREVERGEETPGLRYVASIDPLDSFAD
jgi:hypothetical protein